MEEASLAGRRLRDHGVDARSCEAAFEYEPLGVVEDPFAVCGPVAGHGRSVGFGAAAAALLQARQTLRRKSSCEVSARFFATYAGGYAVWLLYGLSIESVPLILVDAAGLACGLVTLAVTLRMRGALLRPSTWASCPDDPPSTIDGRYGDRGLDPVSVARRNGRRGRVPRARMSES